MTPLAIGLVLALSASVAQSTGFLVQHIGARDRPRVTPRHPLVTLRAAFGSRLWLIGLAVGSMGFVLQLLALSMAPLSLVQAFVAGGLALAAPLASFGFGHPLTRTEWRSVTLMAGALAVLAIGAAPQGSHPEFDAESLAVYLGGISLVTLVVAVMSERRRSALLGLAAGSFYGVLDTSLKALTDLNHGGGLDAALGSPWLLVALAAAAAAFFSFQRALQTGRALPAIALMEAGADSIAIIAGFVAFGDLLGSWPAMASVHVAAFVAVVVAARSLAPVQERVSEPGGRVSEPGGRVPSDRDSLADRSAVPMRRPTRGREPAARVAQR